MRTGGLGTEGFGVCEKDDLVPLEYPETDLALVLILEASEMVGEGGRRGFGVLKGERGLLDDGFVGVIGRSDATVLLVR